MGERGCGKNDRGLQVKQVDRETGCVVVLREQPKGLNDGAIAPCQCEPSANGALAVSILIRFPSTRANTAGRTTSRQHRRTFSKPIGLSAASSIVNSPQRERQKHRGSGCSFVWTRQSRTRFQSQTKVPECHLEAQCPLRTCPCSRKVDDAARRIACRLQRRSNPGSPVNFHFSDVVLQPCP
ncbi:hypothetical protein EK21DRAFT_89239 [Setomelanomma holmii]|uniref:Uncharacterized protein n=1 Tax=Setomelanomma holmii TaxID=210430 RepID=A0A9P4H904_9PLEO|nr:hypothetical protein EK21DRAFT_89239 [Setomelanomma holmii]